MTDQNKIYRELLTELEDYVTKAYKTIKDVRVVTSVEMTPNGTGKMSVSLPDGTEPEKFDVDLNDLEKTKALILNSLN